MTKTKYIVQDKFNHYLAVIQFCMQTHSYSAYKAYTNKSSIFKEVATIELFLICNNV